MVRIVCVLQCYVSPLCTLSGLDFRYNWNEEHRIISLSNVSDPETLRTMDAAIAFIRAKCLELGFDSSSERYDLFIEVPNDLVHGKSGRIGYFLLDHLTRKIFWPEVVASDSVGLPPAISLNHYGLHIPIKITASG